MVNRLADLVRGVAGALLVIVALGMTATIAGRYVGFPTAWADEAARIAFVWSVGLGAASGIHRGLHFAVQLIAGKRNGGSRKFIESAIALLMLSLCGLVLIATTQSIPVAANARLPALGVSGAWFHWAIATFSVLTGVFLLSKLMRIWRTDDPQALLR